MVQEKGEEMKVEELRALIADVPDGTEVIGTHQVHEGELDVWGHPEELCVESVKYNGTALVIEVGP